MGFPYTSKGAEMKGEFKPVPEGFYTLEIKSATDQKDGVPRTTKNGDPYVNMELEISEGEYKGKKVFHNVTFFPEGHKAKGMAIHFLKTIGQPWEGEFDVEPSDWIGATFKAKIKTEDDLEGRPRNKIAFVCDPDPKELDSDVPF